MTALNTLVLLRLASVSMILVALPALSQKLQIRVLDAKSGKPLAGQNITIRWPDFSDPTVLHLDADGSAWLTIRAGESSFWMTTGPKPGKEPYRIAYIDCNDSSHVQVEAAELSGVVPKNECSTRTVSHRVGQVVFWGLPRRWWQPDIQ